MTRERQTTRPSQSIAVAVRLVAFLVAALGVAAIPTTLVAVTVGHLTSHAALVTIAGAALLVLAAAFAAQSVDPLRG